jgi:hypothetical protein
LCTFAQLNLKEGVIKKNMNKGLMIVTQDRDYIYPFTGELETSANWHDGVYMGVNLYEHGKFLGTFDCPEEAIQEINNIFNCKQRFYVINGFSDYDIRGGGTEDEMA